jgi:orotidine-5'-phosphate decarboxylase
MNAADRLFKVMVDVGNPTALGLDTLAEHLPDDFAPLGCESRDICEAIEAYNLALLKNLRDIIGCVKVQTACYERYGIAGMKCLASTLSAARAMGYVVIADAKRGDIGSTAAMYAEAFLNPSSEFAADFLTVNPFFGIDGVLPFIQAAKRHNAGLFILVKTSNPSGAQLQDLDCAGSLLYERIAELVKGWGEDCLGECGYSAVGAVVGATWPRELSALRRRLINTPLLVPGYKTQGATGADLAGCFDQFGGGAVINASRSLLTAHKKTAARNWLEAVRDEALEMRLDLQEALSAGTGGE